MVEDLLSSAGLYVLFFLVALESAGLPLPGETALIAAGVLAARGQFDITAVIVVAAAGAIIGDNAGYWIGRAGGRRLLTRWAWVERHASRVLPWSERFFERHGAKTVFIARFVAVLRVTAAWLAGISHMKWWRFLLWNAAGGICWAVGIGLLAYYAGNAAAEAVNKYGLWGGIAVVVAAVLVLLGFRYWRRRIMSAEGEA